MAKLRLDALLVTRGLFESRAKARAAIEAGGVSVDGATASRPAQRVEETAAIEAVAAHPYVGRGALKLERAIELWRPAIAGRRALDIGASTGGFTEVLLAQGAASVVAVDVGRGQLHPKLAGDPRVTSLEGQDARTLTADQTGAPDLVVCDVSFISLEKALPAALALAAPNADLFALVKPQFEVGREGVGKGGIVRDVAAQEAALEAVKAFVAASGWSVLATADSPILGGDGNREFLLHARKRSS